LGKEKEKKKKQVFYKLLVAAFVKLFHLSEINKQKWEIID